MVCVSGLVGTAGVTARLLLSNIMLDDFDQEFWGRGTGSSGMPMTSGSS